MKNRDKIFLGTALLLFALSWAFMTALVDGAQMVGDASTEFNSAFRAIWAPLILVLAYAILYYVLYWVAKVINNFVKQ